MKRRCLGVVAPLLLLLAACGTDEGASLSPGGAASEAYWFDSLPVMVATSDVVVLGTVVDVRDGPRVGPPGQEVEFLDAVLNVDETLFGSVDKSSPLTVSSLKFVAPEPDWRKVGNTVLAFMKLSTDPIDGGRYYEVNAQSVYLVAGTDVQAAVADDPFSEGVAAMTIDEIRSKIEEAAQAIAAGEVSPQTPVGG